MKQIMIFSKEEIRKLVKSHLQDTEKISYSEDIKILECYEDDDSEFIKLEVSDAN